jgi:hypothetical protein
MEKLQVRSFTTQYISIRQTKVSTLHYTELKMATICIQHDGKKWKIRNSSQDKSKYKFERDGTKLCSTRTALQHTSVTFTMAQKRIGTLHLLNQLRFSPLSGL